MFIIYIADKNLYVDSVSGFCSKRDDALRLPTQQIANDWVDYMAEHFFLGATWRVVPV